MFDAGRGGVKNEKSLYHAAGLAFMHALFTIRSGIESGG
jgi:hypothetical protein